MSIELNFEPQPIIRCKNCGKPKDHHNATTKGCPIGKKHRTLGYTAFSETKFFK